MKVTRKTNPLIFLSVLCISLLLVSSVSGYYCIEQEDNNGVKEFKSDMNKLALQHDIKEHELTEEAFNVKLKYFHPCR